MNTTLTFVIGATASGKTTFIQNYFSNENAVLLNVYDYQQAAYKEAGFGAHIPFAQEFKCLYKANENLLTDIIETLQQGKNVVVEQTLFKAKRRIAYIDTIRKSVKNVVIEVYVMCPTIPVWETYINKRGLDYSAERLKSNAEEIEFPNPSEGFDKIYEVIDNEIRERMDAPNPEIVATALKELQEETERLNKEENEKKQRLALIESMNHRPFWHYCECCGTKVYCTAQEAFDAGWDYPPRVGSFGLLSPRTCDKCNITDTLFWKVQQQSLPLVIEKSLTEKELKTWQRIRNEPESLLTDKNNLD
ncbi:MAG: AAA family ATPase [Clostridia bacterium]|nr:AAA family ATPase [Clostridia bacterium]